MARFKGWIPHVSGASTQTLKVFIRAVKVRCAVGEHLVTVQCCEQPAKRNTGNRSHDLVVR